MLTAEKMAGFQEIFLFVHPFLPRGLIGSIKNHLVFISKDYQWLALIGYLICTEIVQKGHEGFSIKIFDDVGDDGKVEWVSLLEAFLLGKSALGFPFKSEICQEIVRVAVVTNSQLTVHVSSFQSWSEAIAIGLKLGDLNWDVFCFAKGFFLLVRHFVIGINSHGLVHKLLSHSKEVLEG